MVNDASALARCHRFSPGMSYFFAPGIVGARDGLCVVARDLENSDNHATPW